MKDLLINTLTTLGYPVFLQGSLNKEDKYPDNFFTFWNNDGYGRGYYDNKPSEIGFDFDVNFYSVDPTLVNTKLLEAKELLENQGFIIASGEGYDLPSDKPTHTGRGMNVIKLKKEDIANG